MASFFSLIRKWLGWQSGKNGWQKNIFLGGCIFVDLKKWRVGKWTKIPWSAFPLLNWPCFFVFFFSRGGFFGFPHLMSWPPLDDHPRTDGYVAKNHGDCKCPKDRICGTPSKWPNFMACKWGWSDHHLLFVGWSSKHCIAIWDEAIRNRSRESDENPIVTSYVGSWRGFVPSDLADGKTWMQILGMQIVTLPED